MATLVSECRAVAQSLAERDLRIVFAESCTAGLIAASLARIPGISNYLCGSAVTYRNATKEEWLEIPAKLLRSPGPVSEVVARRMAEGVLRRTREADLAAAVTGHLGPNAPTEFDGVVFCSVAYRSAKKIATRVQRFQLRSSSRIQRQKEAAQRVLEFVRQSLNEQPKNRSEATNRGQPKEPSP